jgi:hypothetical protein
MPFVQIFVKCANKVFVILRKYFRGGVTSVKLHEIMTDRPQQTPFVRVPIEKTMRDSAFERGVKSYREGWPPDYDKPFGKLIPTSDNDIANFERGRQWASIAPKSTKIFVKGKLNPRALAIFRKAVEDGSIT